MNFDFKIFQEKLEKELKNIFNNLSKNEKLYSFALYTDTGGMSLAVAANTYDYLQNQIEKDPKDLCYYKWVPDAWKYPYIESDILDELSSELAYLTLNEDKLDFDRYFDKLIEVCIVSLKNSIDSQDIIKIFTISDFDNIEMKIRWLEELNNKEIVDDFLKCKELL